jgi:hypothetical protein
MENSNQPDKNNRWLTIIGIIIIILLVIGIGFAAFYFLRETPQPEPTSAPATVESTEPLPTQPAYTEPPPAESGEIVFQSYAVDPERITAGECVNLTWVVEGADLIQLKRDGAVVLDQAPASHTYQDCLDVSEVYVYRLEASNAANSNWMELQVIVDLASGAAATTQPPGESGSVATLPPATGDVTINYFYVEPERMPAGNCATISWEVLNADQIRLLRDGTVVVPIGQLEDSFQDCHNQSAIYRYRLEAENSEGNYNVLDLQVIVD